ncbi:MAG: hypothetical protein OEZ06_26035 [Myxococcales bacterium]|nr:hypothetical protein [Myxococcales bacterium]
MKLAETPSALEPTMRHTPMVRRPTKRPSRLAKLASCLLLMALCGACEPNPTIKPNKLPTAVARVQGHDVVGGVLELDFDGDPVELTLDGTPCPDAKPEGDAGLPSCTNDADGEIVEYIWLSGTPVPEPTGDGGVDPKAPKRRVPEGEKVDGDDPWPADKGKPEITLPQGSWTVTLWVKDDKGAVSEPSSVTINVGVDASDNPAVAECVAAVPDAVPAECASCACAQSADCQASVPMCDENCWMLLACIGVECADVDPDDMEAGTACITAAATGACVAYISGVAGAMAAGACVTACSAECASM